MQTETGSEVSFFTRMENVRVSMKQPVELSISNGISNSINGVPKTVRRFITRMLPVLIGKKIFWLIQPLCFGYYPMSRPYFR